MIVRKQWRLLAVTMMAVLSLTLAACGMSGTEAAAEDQTPKPAVVVPVVAGAPQTAAAADISGAPQVLPDEADPLEVGAIDADSVVAAYEKVLSGVYDKVLPSVVQIQTLQRSDVGVSSPFGFGVTPDAPSGYSREGEGSGFVWSERGYIVTNNHVIENADQVRVIFADGTEYDAEVVGSEPYADLAVLKVDAPSQELQPVTLGDSNEVKVGQIALAIGSPFGQEFTLTAGIISALGRTQYSSVVQSGVGSYSNPKIIQTDTSINPGNSGGPLLDRLGRVIGINSSIISSSGGNVGVGFAVPINMARRVVPALISEGEYRYAYLGISGTTLSPKLVQEMDIPEGTRGALVQRVIEGGPADKAGIVSGDTPLEINGIVNYLGGDVIIGVDGTPVESMDDLITYMTESSSPGDTVAIELLRADGTTETIDVVLGARPLSGEVVLR